ncbi:MAG: hypoxanthine phosphoribosyltransferase [Dysgonamonadaceae bacterium]|jgi:hypoxanthine phosphoribosyltransferase|nr:hypoxanthine phosphoribosyltransferase [Dysgonamonadaceae bacterium]
MNGLQLKDKKFEIFFPENVILEGIERVSKDIARDMKEKKPLLICVLKGAFMFASDLIKRLDFPCEMGFIHLKSYEGTQSSGTITEIHELAENVENRHLVIVEDIIDTGHTISYLVNRLKANNPASVKIACLLFRPDALKTDIKPDYCALETPNNFIVGYGLDYDGLGRNLRDIYRIKD